MARRAGIRLGVDGEQVSLEWPDTSAAQALIDLLRRFKPEITDLLRAERCAIVRYVADHFRSSPLDRCAHCGGGSRQNDPFLALFVGDDRADIHASCHPEWIAEQEAKARIALGIEASAMGHGHVG